MLKLFLYFLLLFFFSNFSAFSSDFKSSSIRVKSSANMLNLIILLSILIPFTFFLYLILLATINRYADRGQPCLTPLYNLKYPPVLPLLITVDLILLYIILIYPNICSPKFTCFNTFNKNSSLCSQRLSQNLYLKRVWLCLFVRLKKRCLAKV